MRQGFQAGALSGAAIGVSLTLAEVFTGYLAGGRFPLGWWGFLALYYVPGMAAVGGLIALFGARRRVAEDFSMAGCVGALNFAYTAIVANHQYLEMLPFFHAARGATLLLAAVLSWLQSRVVRVVLGRHPPPAREILTFQLLRPILLAASSYAAVTVLQLSDPVWQSLAFLVLVHALTALASWILVGVLLPRRLRWRTALLGMATILAGVCARGLAASPNGLLRDEPQPDPAAHASWLEGKPDIVMIVLDTVGAADLSGYGNVRSTSPNLDALARSATLYANCLAPAPWSLPSHASLFTGLFPSQHLADFDLAAAPCRPRALGPRFETLAETLVRRGYATAAVVANTPTFDPALGLDRGFRHLDARLPAARVELDFEPLLRRLEGRLPYWALGDVRVRWFGRAWRSAEDVVRDAVEWLGSRRPAGRPYFLFLNFMDAHTPYALPPAGAQRSGRLPLSGRPGARAAQRLSAEESRHVRALHEAGVSQLDRHLGRLLAFLESQPGWDRTWLVITSDHGESLAEGRIFGHSCATLSQEVLHVPLILRDPRRPPGAAGARDDSPVQLVDIVPTLFQALGLDLPRKLGGVPIGQGRTAMLALTTCNCPGLQPGAGAGPAEAIVEAGHKYVRIGDAAPQLFDLVNDPGETRDLAAARPERLEQLRSSLDQSKRALAGPAEPCPECDNPRSEEALRALGYVR